MSTVTGIINNNNYETIISNSHHTLISDEPTSLGGNNKGMSPTALLAASLTSCTCITMKMYADRKGWNIDKIKVDVSVKLDIKTGETTITKTVSIDANISDDEKSRLFKISSACPVHKLLAKSATIESTLA